MIHTCEEPTDFYTLHRKRRGAGKAGQSCWLLPSGRAGGDVLSPFLLLNKGLSMNREDGIPLPHSPPPQPAPFRGESSLCPCLTRVSPSFERRTFLRQIFKLKSSRTKAACQLGPGCPAPLPLQPGRHYCLMEEGCEGFRCNIWLGPLSAGETETSDCPIWFLEIAGGASEAAEKVRSRRGHPGWGCREGRSQPPSSPARHEETYARPTAVTSGPWERGAAPA